MLCHLYYYTSNNVCTTRLFHLHRSKHHYFDIQHAGHSSKDGKSIEIWKKVGSYLTGNTQTNPTQLPRNCKLPATQTYEEQCELFNDQLVLLKSQHPFQKKTNRKTVIRSLENSSETKEQAAFFPTALVPYAHNTHYTYLLPYCTQMHACMRVCACNTHSDIVWVVYYQSVTFQNQGKEAIAYLTTIKTQVQAYQADTRTKGVRLHSNVYLGGQSTATQLPTTGN